MGISRIYFTLFCRSPEVAFAQVDHHLHLCHVLTGAFHRLVLQQDRLLDVVARHHESLEDRAADDVDVQPRPTLLFAVDLFSDALERDQEIKQHDNSFAKVPSELQTTN